RADRALWLRHSEDGAQPECGAALHGLDLVGGRPDLPDQAARRSHVAESSAAAAGRFCQGHQGVGPEIRGVRKVLRHMDRGMEQGLRISAMNLSRRSLVAGAGAFALAPFAAQAQFGPPELIEAAKKEGKLVFYSANVAESEQPINEAFTRKFPFIKIEFLRAPGNQLLQRVKTEAAANKLLADVIDHSDRALLAEAESLFADYAPPNADDYIPETRASPKLWPPSTVVWRIAYNTETIKNPPKNWMDLTKPEYNGKQIGQVIAPSGGTTWTRAMFERQVLGDDYWKKQAATQPLLFPSNAPTSDALVRGEISIAPLLYNAILPKLRDGAPVKIFFAPAGAPLT